MKRNLLTLGAMAYFLPCSNTEIFSRYQVLLTQCAVNVLAVVYYPKPEWFRSHSCQVGAARWYACTLILAPLTVSPDAATIHIGISDTPYIRLADSIVGQLSICTSLTGTDTILDCQCQPEATGRYVFVYMDESVGQTHLHISEVQICGDPELAEGM